MKEKCSGVDTGEGAIAPPAIKIPGQEYLFAPQSFSLSVVPV